MSAPSWFIDGVLEGLPPPRDLETGQLLEGYDHAVLFGRQRDLVADARRFLLGAGGNRGGKSQASADRGFIDSLWVTRERTRHGDEREVNYAVVSAGYKLGREEMKRWRERAEAYGFEVEARTPTNGAWYLAYDKVRVYQLTSAQSEKLAATEYRGMIISEAAQHPPDVLQYCRDRVLETGGWVLLNGTFEDAKGPWFERLFAEWQVEGAEGVSYSLPSHENRAAFPGGWTDSKIQADLAAMDPDLFAVRRLGQPRRSSRLMMRYAERHRHVRERLGEGRGSYVEGQPVYLFVDPGVAAAFAVVAVQFDGRDTWVIDTVYRWDRAAPDIVQECQSREWAKDVERFVMDVAARQRHPNGSPAGHGRMDAGLDRRGAGWLAVGGVAARGEGGGQSRVRPAQCGALRRMGRRGGPRALGGCGGQSGALGDAGWPAPVH